MRRWETLDMLTGKHQETPLVNGLGLDQSDWQMENWGAPIWTRNGKIEEHELMMDSGYFEHVCPPWIAPQFPMVISINVETMATNNTGLQRHGPKVMYGHVMTNSGKLNVDPDSFDVMSVREPLLSISALKHRDVTFFFFESRLWTHHFSKRDNEFGISRLSFPFARHFDEWDSFLQSVGNGWRERATKWRGRRSLRQCWKREKLQLMIDEKSSIQINPDSLIFLVKRKLQNYVLLKTAKLRSPETSTDAARMAHNATHVPFRDWCPICVASRGQSSLHRRVVVNKTADTLSKFQTDYFSSEQWQRAKLSHVSHSCKRAVEWWPASCALRKGGFEDLTKEILRQFWSWCIPASNDHSMR